jgi:hypothetical protein
MADDLAAHHSPVRLAEWQDLRERDGVEVDLHRGLLFIRAVAEKVTACG